LPGRKPPERQIIHIVKAGSYDVEQRKTLPSVKFERAGNRFRGLEHPIADYMGKLIITAVVTRAKFAERDDNLRQR
jgi:hypothetical protein